MFSFPRNIRVGGGLDHACRRVGGVAIGPDRRAPLVVQAMRAVQAVRADLALHRTARGHENEMARNVLL
jgi:hypothetical protein